MGRWRDEETRRNRTRRHEDHGYGQREGWDDRYGDRYYDEPRRGRRQGTGVTAIKWTGIVLIALIVGVVLVMVAGDLTSMGGSPDSAQQAPQQPAAPAQDAASSEEVQGLRAEMERQLIQIRQELAELRQYIFSFFTSEQNQQEAGQ